MIARIRATTEKYMPFVTLYTFQKIKASPVIEEQLATVTLRISYALLDIDATKYEDDITIYAGG